MVKLEGGEAGYAFSSGMAAVYSTLAPLLNSGDHVLSCQSIFGSTHTLLQSIFRSGISILLTSKLMR